MFRAGGDNKVEMQNTPFSQVHVERINVIFQYGKFESIVAVRRAFRKKFYPTNCKRVPGPAAFRRLCRRLCKEHKQGEDSQDGPTCQKASRNVCTLKIEIENLF